VKKEQFLQLVEKYLQGTATEAEQLLLYKYYEVLQKDTLYWDETELGNEENAKSRLHANILRDIADREKPIQTVRKTLWPRIAAAAAILLVIGTGLYYAYTIRNANQNLILAQNIKAGGNKAYLTLANGKKLSLTDATNGMLAKEGGVEISKTSDGEIIYTINDQINPSNALHIIETPKGGQYQLSLPDGSKVWLNALSKLIYPVSFKGKRVRAVELIGEAYFEITKDKEHPFHVKTSVQDVEVLGTHFNINSYTDEPATVTTLIEGSVHVLSNYAEPGRIANEAILKPGEQAIQTRSGRLVVSSSADINAAVAWKDGKFWFKEAKLETILKQFSRWYDVDIKYPEGIPDERFSGALDRNLSLADALEILKFTKVNFEIEGRTIIVKK